MTPTIILYQSSEWTYDTNASSTSVLDGFAAVLAKALPSYTVSVSATAPSHANGSQRSGIIIEVLAVGSNVKATTVTKEVKHDYDLRVVLDLSGTDAGESVAEATRQVAGLLLKDDFTFVSTRTNPAAGAPPQTGFLEAVKEGLAKDGGLYMPRRIPTFTRSELAYLCAGPASDATAENRYHRTAQFVTEKLVGLRQDVLPEGEDKKAPRHGSLTLPAPSLIAACLRKAYSPARWNNKTSTVAPLNPLFPAVAGTEAASDAASAATKAVVANHQFVRVLEQYHGPTAAFKDYALQLFPAMFALATLGDSNKTLVLAATSGDTGVAAINGMVNNGPPGTKVMVLFPENGVSAVQKCQMLAMNNGSSVHCIGLGADFDYCQSTVKRIFNDKTVAEKLLSGSGGNGHPTVLSSANSINWGRLLPQIVYYCQAYIDCVNFGEKRLRHPLSTSADELPEAYDVVVPCGNFGNILAAYIAKRMGIPIRHFVVASNENDVLADFINTGVYDISHRSLHVTASPSIDILRASNIERFLYLIYEGDTNKVREHMEQLDSQKKFTLDKDVFEKTVKPLFWAAKCSEKKCKETIASVYAASNKSRILDPHSAVAVAVLDDYLQYLDTQKASEKVPIVVASTAHWAKFPDAVIEGLGLELPIRNADEPLEQYVKRQFSVISDNNSGTDELSAAAVAVPESLRTAVNSVRQVPATVIMTPTYENIVAELFAFASKPIA